MTLVFLLPDLISSAQFWIGAATAWLAEARNGGGETFGLILLLLMSSAIPVAVWWVVYKSLLIWLKARQGSGGHRR